MKRAYFVLGPESTGTRLLTEILIDVGCVGDVGHDQRHDKIPPTDDMIVWRRSFPHSGQWPRVGEMINQVSSLGYKSYAVVTIRDMTATIDSQMATWGRTKEEAIDSIRTAYVFIFECLARFHVPYIIVSYESLVQWKEVALKELFPIIGLDPPEKVNVYDANKKWFSNGEYE